MERGLLGRLLKRQNTQEIDIAQFHRLIWPMRFGNRKEHGNVKGARNNDTSIDHVIGEIRLNAGTSVEEMQEGAVWERGFTSCQRITSRISRIPLCRWFRRFQPEALALEGIGRQPNAARRMRGEKAAPVEGRAVHMQGAKRGRDSL